MNNFVMFNMAVWAICGIVAIFRKDEDVMFYAFMCTLITGLGYAILYH